MKMSSPFGSLKSKRNDRSKLFALLLTIFLLAGIWLTLSSSIENSPLATLPTITLPAIPIIISENIEDIIEDIGEGMGRGGGGGRSLAPLPVEEKRIKATSQGIAGVIENEKFEEVALQIEDVSETVGGYVQSNILSFRDGHWSGKWLLKVSSTEFQRATFILRNLIDDNGEVTSIEVKTEDVTEALQGDISKLPLLSISVDLSEAIKETTVGDRVFLATTSSLNLFLTSLLYLATLLLIVVPSYLVMLLIIAGSRRSLYPLWVRYGIRKREKVVA